MILKDIILNKRFLKDSQLFGVVIEFEDAKGGIQQHTINFAKGGAHDDVAEELKKVAQQIKGR